MSFRAIASAVLAVAARSPAQQQGVLPGAVVDAGFTDSRWLARKLGDLGSQRARGRSGRRAAGAAGAGQRMAHRRVRPVSAQRTLQQYGHGIGLFVHMHLRGRDVTVTVRAPGAEPETVLLVPNYNFDWLQSCRWDAAGKGFPAGTRIEALAQFDNSAFNPFTPDPGQTVKNGLQTADEMMYAFLFYVQEQQQLGLRVEAKTGRAQADQAGR